MPGSIQRLVDQAYAEGENRLFLLALGYDRAPVVLPPNFTLAGPGADRATTVIGTRRRLRYWLLRWLLRLTWPPLEENLRTGPRRADPVHRRAGLGVPVDRAEEQL
jgi:hypothetical protein